MHLKATSPSTLYSYVTNGLDIECQNQKGHLLQYCYNYSLDSFLTDRQSRRSPHLSSCLPLTTGQVATNISIDQEAIDQWDPQADSNYPLNRPCTVTITDARGNVVTGGHDSNKVCSFPLSYRYPLCIPSLSHSRQSTLSSILLLLVCQLIQLSVPDTEKVNSTAPSVIQWKEFASGST